MPDTGTLSEQDIILQAAENFGRDDETYIIESLLDALEAFYMNGFHDECTGDADEQGHLYRVHRWLVWTNSQGFHDIETFDGELEASKAFAAYEEEMYDRSHNDW